MTIYKDNMEQYKEEYYSEIMPRVRKSIRELKNDPDLKDFILQARQRQLSKWQNQLQDLLKRHKQWRQSGMPYWLRDVALQLQGNDKLQKNIASFKMKIRRLKHDNNIHQGHLDEEQIAQARKRDIAELMGIKTTGKRPIMVICPFHQDKDPSFAIYRVGKGAYCFACQTYISDAIDFIQERDGLGFVETVKYLT